MEYVIYVADCETTGLDPIKNDVIELSLFRINDNCQKTWFLKPLDVNNIDANSLKINGSKLEDLRHETKFGRETYLDPTKVIVEIENWIIEDGVPSDFRVMVAQNITFDKIMLEQLWKKCNSSETFPFGRRAMDTMMIEFFLDWCRGTPGEGYSLNNLVKKYGVKNEKAHSAAADTKATKEVFEKQVEFFKRILKNNA